MYNTTINVNLVKLLEDLLLYKEEWKLIKETFMKQCYDLDYREINQIYHWILNNIEKLWLEVGLSYEEMYNILKYWNSIDDYTQEEYDKVIELLETTEIPLNLTQICINLDLNYKNVQKILNNLDKLTVYYKRYKYNEKQENNSNG